MAKQLIKLTLDKKKGYQLTEIEAEGFTDGKCVTELDEFMKTINAQTISRRTKVDVVKLQRVQRAGRR